jgi:hypothetical protein
MFLPENQAEVMEGVEMLLTEIITVLPVEKKEVINQLKVATTELQKENTEKTTQQVLAKETSEDLRRLKEVPAMAIVQEKKVASNHTAPAATTEVQKENTEKMIHQVLAKETPEDLQRQKEVAVLAIVREKKAASNLTAPVVMTEVQKENTEKTTHQVQAKETSEDLQSRKEVAATAIVQEKKVVSNHTAPVAMTEVQKENTEKMIHQVLAKETPEDLQRQKEVAVLAIVREKKVVSNHTAPVVMTEAQNVNTEKTKDRVQAKEIPEDLQHQKEVAVLAIVREKKVVSNHPAPVAMTELQKENTEKIQSVMAVQSLQAELFPKPEGSIPKVKKKHLRFQL